MRNALVVARRELSQLFHSPLAYVFLILFVVLVQLFQVLALFAQGTADLRMFFDTLPWGVALFAAFVTMRSWAEERQENTYEMLLTFPMRDGELVLGKFIASFSFLLLGLACTLTLPLAVVIIGDPDVGAIVSGYIGNTLIAAMWCAGGIFFSGLTRSQLLAVIATAAIAIVSLILGTEIVGTLLGARFGWVGGLIESMIGGWSHYAAFAKGVVELADACYFAAWTLAFLWLNTLYVGVRRSPGRGAVLAVGTPLALGCAMLVGRLTTGESWARADLTEDGLYTLSGGTIRILERAKVPIRVTYFVSPRDEMPKEYDALERQVMDRLHELEIASRGRIVARVSHQSAKNAVVEDETNIDEENPEKALEKAAADPEKSKERRAAAKGVKPFPVSSFGTTEQSTRLIYSTIAIRYREKDEELLQPIIPERLTDLEYLTANTVARLVRARPPKVALYLGPEPMDPQLKQMYQQMKRELPDPFGSIEQILRREKFDVQRIGLTAHEPMPDDYDALVVIGPADLDERQQWEVNRALREGKPTLIAVQRYTWDYRQVERRITANRTTTDPGLDAVLEAQGLGISRDILMDENHVELRVRLGGVQDLMGGAPIRVPTQVLVKQGSMNKDSVLTERLSSLLYVWGTPVTLDESRLAKNGVATKTLFTSSPKSWSVSPDDKKFTFQAPVGGFEARPLAVLARGQFQDAFAGKERPAWPFKMEDMMRDGRPRPAPPDSPVTELKPAPGQLILLGCARLWQQGFAEALGDGSFLLNCLDALTLDEDLLVVRSKQATDRRFDTPKDGQVLFWTLTPLVFVPLVLLAVGLGIGVVRMRRREAWQTEHGR